MNVAKLDLLSVSREYMLQMHLHIKVRGSEFSLSMLGYWHYDRFIPEPISLFIDSYTSISLKIPLMLWDKHLTYRRFILVR